MLLVFIGYIFDNYDLKNNSNQIIDNINENIVNNIEINDIVENIADNTEPINNIDSEKYRQECEQMLDSRNKSDNTYNYDNLTGVYKHITDYYLELSREFSYKLLLFNDGTFVYQLNDGLFGYMGNYIIKDNKVMLNYLFTTGTSPEHRVIIDKKIIDINSLDSLTDNNQPIKDINIQSVNLKREILEKEKELLCNYYNTVSGSLTNGILISDFN